MSDGDLRRVVLTWGVIGVATAATAAIAVGVAVWQEFPLLLLGMILTGISLCVAPVLVGVTDEGIETAAAGSRIGFGAGDASQYNPGTVLPIPNALQAICWLCGVGVGGIALMVVAS